jgi:CCR4-NOT transcription complex subunit 3
MAQSRPAPGPRNLSEADFPPLGSKKAAPPAPAPAAAQPPPAPSPPAPLSALTAAQQLDLFGLKSLDALLQTDFSPLDFAHALSSTLPFVPDPPYDQAPPDPHSDAPPGWPQAPNLRLLQPEFFAKFDEQTLFYIFFYSPGTARQYWAGEELKQRGWFFHRKYNTWFKRAAERPAERAERGAEYEIGPFVYFDTLTREGWCSRVSQPFRFDPEDRAE